MSQSDVQLRYPHKAKIGFLAAALGGPLPIFLDLARKETPL